jgi:hypothetical protein
MSGDISDATLHLPPTGANTSTHANTFDIFVIQRATLFEKLLSHEPDDEIVLIPQLFCGVHTMHPVNFPDIRPSPF